MKRATRPAGLLVAAALLTSAPAAIAVAATAPALTMTAATTPTATANNLSWD